MMISAKRCAVCGGNLQLKSGGTIKCLMCSRETTKDGKPLVTDATPRPRQVGGLFRKWNAGAR